MTGRDIVQINSEPGSWSHYARTGPRIRWLIQFSQARKGVPLKRAMGLEVLDAFKNQGNAIKKRDETHKMAQANKAFAHYKW